MTEVAARHRRLVHVYDFCADVTAVIHRLAITLSRRVRNREPDAAPPLAPTSLLRRWPGPTLLVAVIGLTFSALVWMAAAAWEDRGAEEEFKAAANRKLAMFQGGFEAYSDVMRSYHEFIDGAAGLMDGERLKQVAAPLVEEYIGLSALAWVPRVSGAERSSFEAAARLDGLSEYRISRPTASGLRVAAAEQSEYYPVLYATSKEGIGPLAGYDFGSDPVRRMIFEQARDSGRLVVSGLLPPLTGAGEPQIIAAQAIYAGGQAKYSSVAARRLNFVGFTLGVFRFKEMIDGTLKRLTETRGYHTYVYRKDAAANELPVGIHTSLRAKIPASPLTLGILERQLHLSGRAAVGNQSWLAVVVPMRDPRHGLLGFQALAAFSLCLVLSSLAAVYAQELYRQRRREISLMHEVRASKDWLSTIFNSVNDGIFLTSSETGTFVDINRAGYDMFGYTPGELVGSDIARLSSGVPPYTQTGAMEALAKVRSGGPQQFEWHAKHEDGSLFWVELSLRTATVETKDLGFAVVRDVTERKRMSELIVRMSRYDLLTGLANRHVFVEELERATARARRSAKGFAVLYLDLDQFKDVNDALGHPVGDLLLKAVADRLAASVRATDTVARFGGDEFAVVVSDIHDAAAGVIEVAKIQGVSNPVAIEEMGAIAAGVAKKILMAVSKPFSIQGNDIRCGASVGIALYGPDSPDAEKMLSHADEALYRAKSEGRGTYRFFTAAMDTEVRARVCMSRELREGIASDQLFLLYQPQVDIDTGRIVGLEARVHWHHPTRGDLGPAMFIEAAETNGLIVPLGRWVMREACRQTKQWSDAGIAPPSVAIKVPAVQLKGALELEQDIAMILAEFALPTSRLELQLSKTALMQVSGADNDVLLRLRERGFRIAIEDFGIGYSSLHYLRRHPVDRVKIARSLVEGIGKGSGNDAIVKAALVVVRELGIEAVVEGVETAAQVQLLKAWGARVAQGFYFAEPLPVTEVSRLLRIGVITPARRSSGSVPSGASRAIA